MEVIFETERLIHRKLEVSDAEDMHAMYADPEVFRYLGSGVYNGSVELEAKRIAAHRERLYDALGYGLWATIRKEDGAFMGRCGLLHWAADQLDGQEEIEVAYSLAKRFWGQGYASEAAEGIVAWARENLEWPSLIAMVHEDNYASQGVAEKIGMKIDRRATIWEKPIVINKLLL